MKKYWLLLCPMLLIVFFMSYEKISAQAVKKTKSKKNNHQLPYTGLRPTVSQSENLGSPWTEVSADSVYTGYTALSPLFKNMPSGFDNKIVSFYVPKDHMAVFAENADGTGETITVVAVDAAIKANLPVRLKNKVSFIRYSNINNPGKKGVGIINDAVVQNFSSPWYYSWGLTKPSYPNQQYTPMTWGKGTSTDANIKYLVERKDIDHLLSFNEPDNAKQSNISADIAVELYKMMQKTGLRLGSPVVTQGHAFGAGKWFTNFMLAAQKQQLKIDFICVHWYDWGNQTNNAATDSLTAEQVFSRFVKYMQNVRTAYPNHPIWLTEYNANINRKSDVVHRYFMKLSTEWMNNTSYVERYAYFFPNTVPAANPDNSLTAAGQYWKDLPSTRSFAANIIQDAELIN